MIDMDMKGMVIFIKVKILLILMLLIACSGGEMSEKPVSFVQITDVQESKWKKLSGKKIYFGHQSVGFNIVDGIKDILNDNKQIKLNVVETNDPAEFDKPVFAHSRVGENFDPISKNNAFMKFMENGIGEKTDFAFYKYCYVDVKADTEVEKLFNIYKDVHERLKNNYPGVKVIHVTVPLVVVQKDWRVLIKKIIGREIGGYSDNIKRNLFNDMLRNHYGGKEPVFDIGQIESTYPDGRKETFRVNDKSYNALVPDYASDGRHLNEMGRRVVAEQLLIYLANLSD